MWKLPEHLDGSWSASVNFVPCEKPVRHSHLHLCSWIPPQKNQNKEVGSVISTRTNRNCLLHLRHPSIKLLLGGSQALYHHCLSNSVFSGGQIQHPLTAARATPLTSPGTSSNCLDFSWSREHWARLDTDCHTPQLWCAVLKLGWRGWQPPSPPMEMKWADLLYFTRAADP